MRSLAARRHQINRPAVPVVDDGSLDFPNEGSQEARILVMQEERKAAQNDVSDFVAPYLVSVERFGNALKMQLYAAAVARFRHRLDPQMIRALVDATILQEECRREEIAVYRRDEARKKEARSVRREPVLSSGHI